MRYFREKGQDFIENGNSLVRVGEVAKKPSPFYGDSTVRIFEVLEVRKLNPANPIAVGNHLALSFPNNKLSASEYQWSKNGQWEEKQVPMVIGKEPKPVTKELIRSN